MGNLVLGIGYPVLLFLLIAIFSWLGVIFTPEGLSFAAITLLISWFAGLVMVILLARKKGEMELGKIQKWYVYLAFFLIVTTASNLILENRDRLFGYETFRFPSNSMKDTLLVGDFVISNTNKYGEKGPERGEIVVFLFPKDTSIKYLKRVIGLPDEIVEIREGKVFINGNLIKEDYLNQKYNQRTSMQKPTRFKVPKNSYFVLGDNRDNSNDSRYWGFVPKENIHGSVEFIWFSFDSEIGIQNDRIGQHVK